MAIKALEIDPCHKESAYNYGICLLNQGWPEQAVFFIVLVSAKHPDYPLLMSLLCVLYLCTGNSASAKMIYEKLRASNYAISGYIKERFSVLEQLGHLAMASQLRQNSANMGMK